MRKLAVFKDMAVKRGFSQGFSLIEALVALLVLSFGILGVAAMQLKSIQNSHVSYQRSIATVAAQDTVERLWEALGEAGGECPNTAAIESINIDWHAEWSRHFNGLDELPLSDQGNCEFLITVDWVDERFDDEDVSVFSYITRLPGD